MEATDIAKLCETLSLSEKEGPIIDAEPNSVTVLNDHSPVISITRADQELSNVAVTEPTLHGSNLMKNSSNIHVFPISNLQDGLDNNSTLSQMQTDKIDPIQNDDVTLASLKPTQYVRWKRIAREAKTGVAGPDSVSRKATSSTEMAQPSFSPNRFQFEECWLNDSDCGAIIDSC
ncbi:hypothetical protein ACOSQ4_012702 [Xanthoceras sorbifolium]